MSLSLIVYPVLGFDNNPQMIDFRRGVILGNNRLVLETEFKIFRQIRDLTSFGDEELSLERITPKPLPANHRLAVYEDEGLQKTFNDSYDDRLTYLQAGEFAKITLFDDTSIINKAIISFLITLPKDTMIILYWC